MLTRVRSNRPTATATALRGCALKAQFTNHRSKTLRKSPAVGLTMTGNLWLAHHIPPTARTPIA